MKRWGKTLLGLLLCAVMVTSLLPGMMLTARADGKTISDKLGVGSISNPSSAGVWNKVYFGSKTTPILFNVLATGETRFGGKTLLLDCASILQYLRFDNDGSPNEGASKANEWAYSDIRTWLNGTFLNGRFTAAEISAIAESSKSGKAEGYDGNGWSSLGWASLNGEKVFLLDAVEATNTSYGFENTDLSSTTRVKKMDGSADWWWLRSPYSGTGSHAGIVSLDGTLSVDGVRDDGVDVSPAFNINLSSVIFSSEISSTEKTYKLTIRDNNITITPGTVTRNGSAITVPYTLSGTNKDDVTQVSVVMTNATWNATTGWTVASDGTPEKYYYGQLSSNSFTLPADYDSSWKTYIIAEDVNAGTATDYASAPVEITIPHAHDFTYTASGATITAKCAAGCPDGYDTTGITLTLKAPTNLKYDGNAKEATIDGYPATAPAGLAAKPATVSYYNSTGAGSTTTSGSALSGAPSSCGNYVAQMTWGGITASLPFSITNNAISFNVTFKVVNGGWDDTGSSDPIVVTLSRAENEDKLLKLEAGDIPSAGNKPAAGYMAGNWGDPAPSTELVISEDKEYTYTYAAKGTENLAVTQADAVYGDALEEPTYTKPAGTTKDPVISYTGTLWDSSSYGPSAVKPTETGSYTVSVTEETADTIYTGTADFAITPKSITGATVKLSALQLQYNGSEQSVTIDSVTLDGAVLAGTDYTVSGDTKGTDKGTYTVTVTGKGNYKNSATASWEIVEKPMTVSAPDVSVSYDGNAHGISVNVTDPASGYTVKYGTAAGTYDLDASPTITNVSESPKTVYYRVTADNYSAFTGYAKITIIPAKLNITVSGDNSTKVYNGEEQAFTGTVTATSTDAAFDASKFNYTGSTTAKGTVVGDYITSPAEENCSYADNNYDVKWTIGDPVKLTISPKTVTVTAESKVFAYNGTAQSWPEYDVFGLEGTDEIKAVVTGSITYPTESPVVNKLESYVFTKGDPQNYSVTTVDGELTMANASTAITITAASQEWMYDGSAHSNSTVTVTEGKLLSGDTLVATATGSVTNVSDTKADNNPIADGYKVMHGDTDVTANYAITPVAGTLTIAKATQAVPAAPTVEDVTENSVTLKATAGYQYSIDGTTWQDSPVFTRLSQNTEYTFYQRIAGDDNHESSPASTGTTATTGSVIYNVTNVQGGEHTVGDGKDAVITVKCNVDDAHTYNRYSSTTVDGKAVPEDSTSTASGSLLLTLKAAYLDTLSVGEHKVTIVFTDGTAKTTLKIKAAPPTPAPTRVPQTGDTANFPLWIGLVLLGLIGISLLGLTALKHRK